MADVHKQNSANTEVKGTKMSQTCEQTGKPLDSCQTEGPRNDLHQQKSSCTLSIGNEKAPKKFWGRHISKRNHTASLSEKEHHDSVDATRESPRIQRAATWYRERRTTMEEGLSCNHPSQDGKLGDSKIYLHAQVLDDCQKDLNDVSAKIHLIFLHSYFALCRV
jgi:hypothetical protein